MAPTIFGSEPTPVIEGDFKEVLSILVIVTLLAAAISFKDAPSILALIKIAFFWFTKIGFTVLTALDDFNKPFSVLLVRKATT